MDSNREKFSRSKPREVATTWKPSRVYTDVGVYTVVGM
jgi:hypothetical protein